MAFLALCIATEFGASQALSVLPCFYKYESRALKASTARVLFHHLRTPYVDIRSNFITRGVNHDGVIINLPIYLHTNSHVKKHQQYIQQ